MCNLRKVSIILAELSRISLLELHIYYILDRIERIVQSCYSIEARICGVQFVKYDDIKVR